MHPRTEDPAPVICPACGGENPADAVFCANSSRHKALGGFKYVLADKNTPITGENSSLVWPDDRKIAELGTISVAAVVRNSAAAERELAFDPARLTVGIGLSDDPLPALRSRVYALSVLHRHGQ
jgi:hypothetical protein